MHIYIIYTVYIEFVPLIRLDVNKIYRDAVSSRISSVVTKGHNTCHSCHRGTPQGKTVCEDWTVTVVTWD